MEALVQPGLLIFSFLWSRTLISTIDLSGFNQCKIAVWQKKKKKNLQCLLIMGVLLSVISVGHSSYLLPCLLSNIAGRNKASGS